jgi:hypothetical protein
LQWSKDQECKKLQREIAALSEKSSLEKSNQMKDVEAIKQEIHSRFAQEL